MCATFKFVHQTKFSFLSFCLTNVQCNCDGTGEEYFTFVIQYENTIFVTFKNPVTTIPTYKEGKNTHHQHKIAFYFDGEMKF